ncbi:MAG: M24 family metallopeptidase [Phycisphaerales bacterium]
MTTNSADKKAYIWGGVPAHNPWLLHKTRFVVGDPVAYLSIPNGAAKPETFFILREIELDRAKKQADATHVHGYSDFTPSSGLSGDRETATAQSAAECLTRKGVKEVWTDRSLPMLFTHVLESAGVKVRCDPELGVLERRSKTPKEVEALRAAQSMTERAIKMACEMIARAKADASGILQHDGAPLTSERVKSAINIFLLENGFSTSDSIVAGGPQGGDCHERGSGPLRTGQPVIVDVFPMDPKTHYFGDCTRTVVHGIIPPEIAEMHSAVVEAKRAAINATRVGATGQQVHEAACAVFKKHAFATGLPPRNTPGKPGTTFAHGTGHGVGLDVHEPPLLAEGGPALVEGDCLTIEPGLYSHTLGGIRIEDMVIVRAHAVDNLNTLPEGLTWA